jgi:ATP-dependent Lhr-like helicase
MSALAPFSDAVRTWFEAAFAAPTPVQARGWAEIASGRHALLLAPTGSGKTLAAFLWSLDRLVSRPRPPDAAPGVRVLYVSPLKALVYDVEKNLRAPLAGIQAAARRGGGQPPAVRVAMRTGDTPSRERQRFTRNPSDILVTTPESLFLLLTSKAREALRSVEVVIVDEIHAVAGTKRGAHLALSLERLSDLCDTEPQRVGLSATQRPLSEIAAFLGGDRPVEIVDASEPPALDLAVIVPVDDMENPPPPEPAPQLPAPDPEGDLLGMIDEELALPNPASTLPGDRAGIWAAIPPRVLELVRAHTTTIVFCNSRRLTERLSQRLNELAVSEGLPPVARAHHGSVSHAERMHIEEALKSGTLPCICATSSLELGIDMGAVDLVIQIEAPISVASGLQRVGRAGHQVGEQSRGRIFPKYRGDLLEAAVVARAMRRGEIEATRIPRNPLDVLAQQIVAMCVVEDRALPELAAVLRRARPYRDLSEDALVAVLDMLSGRYPVDLGPVDGSIPDERGFAALRPRLHWDRATDTLSARKGARLVVLANAGTIPDRGLYGVFVAPDGPRVGELDEEMVHESRRGDTFLLGASTWRIVEIKRDRVMVVPAPGEAGRMPFWRGEGPGRPSELGLAMGALVREVGARIDDGGAPAWLAEHCGLDERAASNLVSYIREQRDETGGLPTDRSITVERFRDELGDWRICLLCPLGSRITAPWAMAISALLESRVGGGLQALWTDDGVVLRVPDDQELPALDDLLPDPDEVEELILGQLAASSLFAARFREAAGRALLLPRRRPGQRTPLWLQRMKAQNLLETARRYPSFPIVLEAYRECLQDVFDLPGLVALLRGIRSRAVRVVEVETPQASPFARSLVFAFVASWLYEGDAPLAERRLQALSIDRALLRELLGDDELRDLLDPVVIAEVEAELQGAAEGRRARSDDALHDLLRRVGDLSEDEVRARFEGEPEPALERLRVTRRAVRVRVGGEPRWIAVEDVARYRDGLGVVPPGGLPAAFLGPARRPLDALLLRHAATHGPFSEAQVARRWGLLPAQVQPLLESLAAVGRLLHGAFGGDRASWCDADVLRRIKRRTLARLRGEIEPVDADALARFLPDWQGAVGDRRGGAEARLLDALAQLEGCPLPFGDLERAILPARVPSYQPTMLDALGASGELVWVGRGALGPKDGRVVLLRRESVGLLGVPPDPPPDTPMAAALLDVLTRRGACFEVELRRGVEEAGLDPSGMTDTLWDLVWGGHVTNDTFAPLRALGRSTPRKAAARRSPRLRRGWGRVSGVRVGGGRWSLVSGLLEHTPTPTEQALARVGMLLDRYGVVGREVVGVEEIPGGFSALYEVLRSMEEAGQVRRGWFVAGLGGAQFAVPGAVDRLRAWRDTPADAVVMATTDPALVWGAAAPWPARSGDPAVPRRESGARAVLVEGAPVLALGRGGRSLHVFPVARDPGVMGAAVSALRASLLRERRTAVSVARVDGTPAEDSGWRGPLIAAGFTADGAALRLSPPL